jgi:hypothetical protein
MNLISWKNTLHFGNILLLYASSFNLPTAVLVNLDRRVIKQPHCMHKQRNYMSVQKVHAIATLEIK